MHEHNRRKQNKGKQTSEDDLFAPDQEPDRQAQNATE